MTRTLGAIVAGGRASRFGADKALAEWRGRPLIAHAAAALVPFCAELVVVGRDWEELVRVDDVPAPGLGPLGGIAGALAWAEAHGFAGVLTIGCDMPDVPAELVARIAARAPAYCREAPILGHWPAASADALADRLRHETARGARSIRGWAEAIGALPIVAHAPLVNVNTPADLPGARVPA